MGMLREFLADTLAPRVCAGCHSEGTWLCERCADAIPRDPNVTCVGCSRIAPFGATCERCRRELPLDGVLATTSYDHPVIQRLLHAVKYTPARDIAGAFASFVDRCLSDALRAHLREVLGPAPCLVPVPLHWRREAARGFNQSRILAEHLARAGVGTVADVLIRERLTQPQVALAHDARAANVRDAFACASPALIHGRSVLLVDDVVTTGATMAACARALRRAGARPIVGFAMARG